MRILTDEDVAEVRALWASGRFKQWELSDLFDVELRYLKKVLYYEVRCNVPDLDDVVRRPKRKYNKSVLVASKVS